MERRKFLSGMAITTVAAMGASRSFAKESPPRMAANPKVNVTTLAPPAMERVRFGFIGVGNRGGETLLRLTLKLDGADVVALCDIDEENLTTNTQRVLDATGKKPATYSGSDTAYKKMLERDDIDAVVIATPWRWHTPMALDAMRAGKHAFVEVPAATSVEDCWQLVETSEKTQKHCMMLENVCYGREEMMLLNMVKENLFGDLLHADGAYIHELRWQMKEMHRGTGSWRTGWHTKRDANLYPTHGLGPIAQYLNINRGDQLDYLVSMSSPAMGRKQYAQREFPAGHQRNQLNYITGDMNSTLIKTKLGRSILLQHDTTTPRPYSRLNLLQGTNGVFAGFPNRIALENNPLAPNQKEGFHHWDTDMDKWFKRYDHIMWRKIQKQAENAGGHGGMDFMMMWRLVYCLRNGLPLDQNVYDAASWSVIVHLSEMSVSKRSASVDIPDFTRGAWQHNAPLDITLS